MGAWPLPYSNNIHLFHRSLLFHLIGYNAASLKYFCRKDEVCFSDLPCDVFLHEDPCTVPFLAQYSRGLGLPLDLKDPSPGESCVQYLRVGDGGGVDSRSPHLLPPSQPIMSDGSSPPAMGGEGRGHNGHTRVEKWAAGRMECRINDICITPNTTVMYDVKNTNTPKKTFCCNDDSMAFSRRLMARCQKYKPDYINLKHYFFGFWLVMPCTYAMKHRRKKLLFEMFCSFLLVFTTYM